MLSKNSKFNTSIKILIGTFLLMLVGPFSFAKMPNSTSPDAAEVYFIFPQDGSVFDRANASEIEIVFGIKGMEISHAGIAIPNSGHHHLLINIETLPDLTMPLPASEQVRHFGKGQTRTTIKLGQGKHRLQLVLGNHVHIPHNPPVMSKVIEIEVK